MQERLQKILAQAGVASRRKCEELIRSGRVSVNGHAVTELGVKVDPEQDQVAVDGRRLEPQTRVCLMLHKPTATVTTVSDPQ
ncbi:MAG: pseudouridine synthase, partial [Alicyclobacillus sp.]|nr:pseudouridine synthase [Alicyclobacillus sp.]